MDILSYSAYGEDSECARVPAGHVKLNGVAVWRSSWCGRYTDHRGVNILLIDPFRCIKKSWARFDTHISTARSTALANYLKMMDYGIVMVGLSADEATWRITSSALSALRQLGVEVADVQHRGSFAFIAQKGFASKSVLRKVLTGAASYSRPAQLNATVTGTAYRPVYQVNPYG